MKSAQINKYGGSEMISILDVPKPQIAADKVLIEVHAASINPFDIKLQSGIYQKTIPLSLPFTVGADLAGKIIEIGENVNDFQVGDEVFGQSSPLQGGTGAFAEVALAEINEIALKPKTLRFEEAAALPLVGCSAIQAVEEHIQIHANQKILIHGGAGGIGSLAIQIAKFHGAYVATTVKNEDVDFVQNLGADETIDYTSSRFEEILKGYDAVFDTAGGETTDKSFLILKAGGKLVSMLGKPNPDLAKKYGVTAIGQQTETSAAHLRRVADMVDGGHLKTNLSKIFPLKNTAEAFGYFEKQRPRGKVIVTMK